MRLLFVKLKHIGDSLLLTPTLTAARAAHPQAEIRVIVRKGCEGILAGCPALDRVHTSAAPEAKNRSFLSGVVGDVRLAITLRRWRPDYAFELSDGDRGRMLVWLSGARVRCANTQGWPPQCWWRKTFNAFSQYAWLSSHRVEKDYFTVNEFLPLPKEVPPMVFERSRTERWQPAERLASFAVIHPGTRWVRKRWPVEKWVELGQWLLGRVPHLIISAGPDPGEVQNARQIQLTLGNRALTTEGQTNWAQLAELLYRARLFVGVDTAAMHLAAACQCPSVVIFGQTNSAQWHPWKVRHKVVTASPQSLQDLPPEEYARAAEVGDVISACREMI